MPRTISPEIMGRLPKKKRKLFSPVDPETIREVFSTLREGLSSFHVSLLNIEGNEKVPPFLSPRGSRNARRQKTNSSLQRYAKTESNRIALQVKNAKEEARLQEKLAFMFENPAPKSGSRGTRSSSSTTVTSDGVEIGEMF